MSSKYCLDPPRHLFGDLLPNGALAEFETLWIFPANLRLGGKELGAINEAFIGKDLVISKASIYWGAAIAHLKEKPEVLKRLETQGVFNIDDRIAGEVISRLNVSTQYPKNGKEFDSAKRLYSDVAWVDKALVLESDDPFRGWGLGNTSSLAMVANNEWQPNLWATLVQSLALHKFATRMASDNIDSSASDTVVKMKEKYCAHAISVITAAITSGIVPSLQCVDIDTATATVFWGPQAELREAVANLSESFEEIDGSTLERWLARGASFVGIT